MPITVTVRRGNPLPWGPALALTVVGAVMVVIGIAVVGRIDPGTGQTGALPTWLIAIVIVPAWGVAGVVWTRRARDRRTVVADAGVPEVLAEPPDDLDPAVVAVVLGRGRTPSRAVVATLLSLADRGFVAVQEVGDRVVVSFDPSPPADAGPASGTDALVYRALAARADAASGDVVGPPLWPETGSWWPAYARDARARAISDGMVEARLPFVGLMILSVLTATAVALAIFWYTVAFVGLILLANGLPHLIVRAGGYRLSPAGLVERARWLAFGRGLNERGGLSNAGPGAVTMWGRYLVYGVLMGAGAPTVRALAPAVARDTEMPEDSVMVLR